MNEITSLIPAPDSLPVAAIWLQILSLLTYFLHLISTGVTFGTAAQAIVAHYKGKQNPQWQGIASSHTRILPFAIAFTINSGVAPLLFLQTLYGNFFYTSAIIVAIPLLAIILFLMTSYYLAYWVVLKKEASAKWRAAMSLMVILFFSAIAFILVNINSLMLVPKNWKIYFNSMAGWNLNLNDPTLVPRYTLYLFLFLVIGGAFSAIFFKKTKRENGGLGFHFGANLAGYFSFVTAPAFTLFLLMLPEAVRDQLFNTGRLWGALIICFIILLILTGWFYLRRRVYLAGSLLVASLILFVFIRDHIRFLHLQPFKNHFSPIAAQTQYGVMALFFVLLILGVGLTIWLLIKVKKEYQSSTQQ